MAKYTALDVSPEFEAKILCKDADVDMDISAENTLDYINFIASISAQVYFQFQDASPDEMIKQFKTALKYYISLAVN